MLEAKPSDLSIMPLGMCASQLSMGRPKMRNGIPRWRKCAAIESPYGPAPTTAIFVFSIALGETPCSDLGPEVWFYLEPAKHAGILGGREIISRPRLS